MTCGALLWQWEKLMYASSSTGDGRRSGLQLMQSSAMAADPGVVVRSGQPHHAAGGACKAAARRPEEGEGASILAGGTDPEEMTPLEAFLSCFYDDLRNNRP